jgi:hypothetical protein
MWVRVPPLSSFLGVIMNNRPIMQLVDGYDEYSIPQELRESIINARLYGNHNFKDVIDNLEKYTDDPYGIESDLICVVCKKLEKSKVVLHPYFCSRICKKEFDLKLCNDIQIHCDRMNPLDL